MDVVVQETVREWHNAATDLVEFLSRRRRDPRALTPHVWGLIRRRVERLRRASAALSRVIQQIVDNPLIHFFPPVPPAHPTRYRPPSNEDVFLLGRPQIARANGPATWSVRANASSSEDEDPEDQ